MTGLENALGNEIKWAIKTSIYRRFLFLHVGDLSAVIYLAMGAIFDHDVQLVMMMMMMMMLLLLMMVIRRSNVFVNVYKVTCTHRLLRVFHKVPRLSSVLLEKVTPPRYSRKLLRQKCLKGIHFLALRVVCLPFILLEGVFSLPAMKRHCLCQNVCISWSPNN